MLGLRAIVAQNKLLVNVSESLKSEKKLNEKKIRQSNKSSENQSKEINELKVKNENLDTITRDAKAELQELKSTLKSREYALVKLEEKIVKLEQDLVKKGKFMRKKRKSTEGYRNLLMILLVKPLFNLLQQQRDSSNNSAHPHGAARDCPH